MNEKALETYAKRVIDLSREITSKRKLDPDRFPPWVRSASIKAASYRGQNLLLISDGAGGDNFEYYDDIVSDTELYFDINYEDVNKSALELPEHSLETQNGVKFTTLTGQRGEDGGSTINIPPEIMLLASQPHEIPNPFSVSNLFLQLDNAGDYMGTSFIPAALYVHDYFFDNPDNLIKPSAKELYSIIETTYVSGWGDYYETKTTRRQNILSRVDDTAIVLGKYDNDELERQLEEVSNALEARGYQAPLIKDLPSHPSHSMPRKVKLWAIASRFCVIIDRDPSGHLVEYSDLKNEGILLAILRKKGSGSTRMIAHEEFSSKYIRVFEFDDSPVQVIDDVITWVESEIDGFEDYYSDLYDWR
ncbi:hypothetical protein [Natrinema sp. CBA1119]|uniref:hypothetical protein n=1 Tax=Natrinema sp. CBA1119 TaxID=1608465 RepID=UPI001145E8D1|nr:hypothetical protein [Natrinema sp. CBA1119]